MERCIECSLLKKALVLDRECVNTESATLYSRVKECVDDTKGKTATKADHT